MVLAPDHHYPYVIYRVLPMAQPFLQIPLFKVQPIVVSIAVFQLQAPNRVVEHHQERIQYVCYNMVLFSFLVYY